MAEHRFFIRGAIDVTSSPQLGARLAEPVVYGDADVLLDCSQMTAIDSSGIRVLIEANRFLEAQGRHMLIVNVNPMLRQIFDDHGLTELLQVERGLIST
jgi:anti-anti-sigma factor